MIRKKRWIGLLAFTAFSVSCGTSSLPLDTLVTNDIDYYWDLIQYDPSPNGYARFQDGWYEGNSTSKSQWVYPNDPSFLYSVYSEEQSVFRIEWPKNNMGSHVLYPSGNITAMEAHYRYERRQTDSDITKFGVQSTLSASEGMFCLNQTIVCVENNQETTEVKSFYGPFDGVEFSSPWGQTYLKPDSFGNYSFSKETNTLDYRAEISNPETEDAAFFLSNFRLIYMPFNRLSVNRKASRFGKMKWEMVLALTFLKELIPFP